MGDRYNVSINQINQIIKYVETTDLNDDLNKQYLISILENLKISDVISINKYRETYHHCYDENLIN